MQKKAMSSFIKQTIPLFALFVGLVVGLAAIKMNTESRKRAANTSVTLSLLPSSGNIMLGSTNQYDLIATFTGGSSTETLDYFRTQIEFNTLYLELPASDYIDTTTSGFDQIFRVDGPQAANGNGKIIIELGSKLHPGPSTSTAVTIAKIHFRGKMLTPGTGTQPLTLTQTATQIVNNQSIPLGLNIQSGSYRVINGNGATPSPTGLPPGCERGEKGNLDCDVDGCIDTSDFELFRQGYGHRKADLNIPPEHHTPDLIDDSDGYVDTADYNILYQNFGTCK